MVAVATALFSSQILAGLLLTTCECAVFKWLFSEENREGLPITQPHPSYASHESRGMKIYKNMLPKGCFSDNEPTKWYLKPQL